MQNKIVSTLSSIRKYPGMYLGAQSLKLLRAYIDGYTFAMSQEGIDCGAEVYYNFNKWLAEKYNIRETMLWDDYLSAYCDSEETAFLLE